MLLVNTPFDGRGYGGWRRGMLIALSAKNTVGLIDGIFLQPKISSDDFKSWTRCNDMVISWLLNSLSKAIAESVLYTKTAKEILDELEERFGQSSGPQLYHLQKEISESTQGNLDIAGYYTKLKKLWDELDSLDVCQHCTCDCSCGGKLKNYKSQQDSRLIQFLMGLNDTYAAARSNLLLLSLLPSLSHAYSLLIRDEKQREVHISHHPAESAFVAAQRSYGGQKVTPAKKFNMETKKGTKFCNYCKKQNHTIENCYRLIGFTSDFKFTISKRFNEHRAMQQFPWKHQILSQIVQETNP
ncbi:PREDICTED: uncharacterized protein LOC109216556 [Nicotiana attenuata]|uniref:uncharacterized protein LOC109216556 n=1 Tax=Nicotiana attenuata TaxID=49451 RepID=UPI000904922C|nr:PREDICTED: uncharacterized protein LOC109216556 [Nicotiana attenuata]